MREIPEREIAHRTGRESQEAGSEDVAESADVHEEPVVLQPLDQPVRGGPCETRSFHHVRERSSAAFDRAQHGYASIEDADCGPWGVALKLIGETGPPGADPSVVSQPKLAGRPLPLEVVLRSCYHGDSIIWN